jgi:hypothetical protein
LLPQTRWVAVAAIAKIVVALGFSAFLYNPLAENWPLGLIFIIHVLVFAGAGLYLILAGWRDHRAAYLGGFFSLIAVSFADGVAARGAGSSEAPLALAWMLAFHPEAFLPMLLWGFIRHFPELRRFDRGQRVQDFFLGASLVAGVACFSASALAVLAGTLPPGQWWFAVVSRFSWAREDSWYWPILFGLAVPALPFGLWKARLATVTERRRFTVFLLGLLVGFLPIAIEVLLEAASARYREFMSSPWRRAVGAFVLYPLLLSIPFTTAYSVRVNRVLDVRLVIRRTVQYALARGTLLFVAAVPVVALVVSSVSHRSEPLGALLTGKGTISVLVTLSLTLLALGARRPLLHALDKRFFVDQLDGRKLLQDLAERRIDTGSVQAVCGAFGEQLREALHVGVVQVLIADDDRGVLVSPAASTRLLSSSSALARVLQDMPGAIVVDLERPTPIVRHLPDDEKQWLADTDAHVLIPLQTGGRFLGVMLIGEKVNGLPFSREDLSHLTPVALALALSLENAHLRELSAGRALEVPPPAEVAEQAEHPARICSRCQLVAAAEDGLCTGCGGALVAAELPTLLLGKFLLKRQIGRGGMGVVYEAIDVSLQRSVAIKTLPRLSASQSVRLRREARMMAGFVHPNLATIFGIESWRGAPALVMELLDGGTLAARLRTSRLAPEEVLRIAAALMSAIALVHDSGLLHRDVKPSNIGFTQAGVPKLLDFGLAQMLEVAVPAPTQDQRHVRIASGNLTTVSSSGPFAGTPGYMAPETLRGQRVDGTADLWSFGVVMYEALTGRKPFRRDSLPEGAASSSARIAADLLDKVPDCPKGLAALVSDLLAPDRRQRPATAHHVVARLRECAGEAPTFV